MGTITSRHLEINKSGITKKIQEHFRVKGAEIPKETKAISLGVVVHAINPSPAGEETHKFLSLRPAWSTQ